MSRKIPEKIGIKKGTKKPLTFESKPVIWIHSNENDSHLDRGFPDRNPDSWWIEEFRFNHKLVSPAR